MEDRDVKKTFVIPKAYASSKDVLIAEKIDSRNVIELFNDMKTSALDNQFDFRTNSCKSCDLIRNPKLQKLYSEKRLKMRKEQEPNERFAFHYIFQRDIALKIATDGIQCDQLTLPIEKYLGNPKEGVHLVKRADVLLTSTGTQGLYKFGLLICKILLGKGYPTIPSANNHQFAAQLHSDHHFCKILPNQPETKTSDDRLARSLIFCYEHENFQSVSHPSQILPIAILWYDLDEKFPSENHSLTMTNNENSKKKFPRRKTPITKTNEIPSKLKTGSWGEPKPIDLMKIPSAFLIPFHHTVSQPAISHTNESLISPNQQQISQTRDPRLLKKKMETISNGTETIPLSPQRSISENGLATTTTKSPMKDSFSSTTVKIPLSSLIPLPDPRIVSLTPNRTVVYLEFNAVKQYFQQPKRSNSYQDGKNTQTNKSNYMLIPYLVRQVSLEEFERISSDSSLTTKSIRHSTKFDCSSLFVSVVDFFTFGFSTNSNRSYIDLEQAGNQVAYEQLQISNELIERERQINSQHIRLRLREIRQRKFQHHLNQKRNEQMKIASNHSLISPSATSKSHVVSGRQMLKEYPLTDTSANPTCSTELIEFLSREYRHENRSHVKHLLAELVGIFIEKYHLEQPRKRSKSNNSTSDMTINTVIDMDLASPSPSNRCDHDERFRLPSPPPPPPPIPASLLCLALPSTTIVEPLKETDNLVERPSTVTTLITTKTESISPVDESKETPELSIDDTDRSRDEFVRLLAKKVNVKNSPSPVERVRSVENSSETREFHQPSIEKDRSPQPLKRSVHHDQRHSRSPETTPKKISSLRTVTVVSNRSVIVDPIETNQDDEPMSKRRKTNDRNEEIDDERHLLLKSRIAIAKEQKKEEQEEGDDLNGKSVDSGRQVINAHSKSRRRRSTTRRESPRMRKFSRESNERSRTYSKPSLNGRRTSPSPSASRINHHQRRSTSDRYHHSDSFNLSSSSYPRAMNDILGPTSSLSHKRFNYNHQSVADHLRFGSINSLSSMETMYPGSPPPPLMSLDRSYHLNDSSRSNRSNGISRSFDTKRSDNFQRFNLYIDKNSKESDEYSPNDYSRHSIRKSSNRSSRSSHDNDPPPLRMVQR